MTLSFEERIAALEEEVRQLRELVGPEVHPLVAGFGRFQKEATRRDEAKREQAE